MRDLTRRERCAMNALSTRLDRTPELGPLVVEDYARAASAYHETRKRLSELTFASDREDDTGFAPGCVL